MKWLSLLWMYVKVFFVWKKNFFVWKKTCVHLSYIGDGTPQNRKDTYYIVEAMFGTFSPVEAMFGTFSPSVASLLHLHVLFKSNKKKKHAVDGQGHKC